MKTKKKFIFKTEANQYFVFFILYKTYTTVWQYTPVQKNVSQRLKETVSRVQGKNNATRERSNDYLYISGLASICLLFKKNIQFEARMIVLICTFWPRTSLGSCDTVPL